LATGIAVFLVLALRPQSEGRVVPPTVVPLVELAEAKAHQGSLDLEADGVVVVFRQIQLAAQVEGQIVFKDARCRAGHLVPPETVLLKIDPEDYEIRVKTLEQELAQAIKSLAEVDVEIGNTEQLLRLAEEDYQLQSRDYARQQQLHRDRVISDAEVEQARRQLLQSENALTGLKNQLRLLQAKKERLQTSKERAEVQLDEAKLQRARTEVRSPADSVVVVTRDLVEAGDYVRVGTALVVLEDVTRAEIRCSLRPDQLAWVWASANQFPIAPEQSDRSEPFARAYALPRVPVTVVYPFQGAEFLWDGVLWRYEGLGLDEPTRTVPCRILVENPRVVRRGDTPEAWRMPSQPPALVRGMYVNLRLHTMPGIRLLRIPEQAIQPGNWIWRFDPIPEGPSDSQNPQMGKTRSAPGSNSLAAGDNPPRSDPEGFPGTTDASRQASPEADAQQAGRRGQITRVEVQPSSVLRIRRLYYRDPLGERVIDGRRLQIVQGQLIFVDDRGESRVLGPAKVSVLENGEPQLLDGVQYRVVDGIVQKREQGGWKELLLPRLVVEENSGILVRETRYVVVIERPGVLEPGSLVVITPVAASAGSVVQEHRPL